MGQGPGCQALRAGRGWTGAAACESEANVKNVVEALVDSVGIPQKNFVEKACKQVEVIMPVGAEGEVKNVMQSHQPKNISARVWA